MTIPDDSSFISYAHQDLSRKKIVKYAQQYDGVDMTRLIGADDSNTPFLIGSDDDNCVIMFWSRSCGMIEYTDEDPVRGYATQRYLLDHAHPVFDSIADAEKYAIEHDWPCGPFPTQNAAEPRDAPESSS